MLSRACGAVLDNSVLIAACVVGDMPITETLAAVDLLRRHLLDKDFDSNTRATSSSIERRACRRFVTGRGLVEGWVIFK